MILYIDTAHEIGYIALGNELYLMEGRHHSETAALLLERVWHQGIEGIGVGVGPGSYTGLRVGIALAQGLHLATGIPLQGYCSLAAYWEEGSIALLDARGGGVYCWDGQRAFRASIEELGKMSASLVSPDAEKIADRLKEAGYQQKIKKIKPELSQIARGSLNQVALEPIYLKSL